MNDLKTRIELLKLHFGVKGDDLALQGGVSLGTYYRILKGDVTEKQLLKFTERLGVSIEWLKFGEGNMLSDGSGTTFPYNKPTITTQSTDVAVMELVREVNFLREQLEKRDKQFDSLLEILKQEDNGLEPPVYVMHPYGLPSERQYA